MDKVIVQTGDIFFTDNFSTASKIVKFLMQSPTIYHQIWRWYRGTLNEVRFYHAGMVLNEEDMIEQDAKVRIRPVKKIFKKNYVIWRKNDLTEQEKNRLVEVAMADFGEGYDIVLCIGKLFTWLTGIPFFTRWIQQREKEICVTRLASWFLESIGEDFGCKSHHEATTYRIDDYCVINYKDWTQVVIKIEEEL